MGQKSAMPRPEQRDRPEEAGEHEGMREAAMTERAAVRHPRWNPMTSRSGTLDATAAAMSSRRPIASRPAPKPRASGTAGCEKIVGNVRFSRAA